MSEIVVALLVSGTAALSGMLYIRTDGIFTRSGTMLVPANNAIALLETLTLPSYFALLIFQGLRGSWWHPIVTILVTGVLAGALVTRPSLAFFTIIRHPLAFICVAGAIGCWFLPD
jgi:ABC-type enterochelin transport system permease subunit